MGEIVNLNRARKARDKAADKAVASANRAAHGQTKAQRQLSQAERDRASRLLDGAKREDLGLDLLGRADHQHLPEDDEDQAG